MRNANIELKVKIAENGFYLWEVAEKIGMADTSFSRLLRKPLSEEKKVQIDAALEALTAERGEISGR
ncbi:MAG: hypothetical protein LKJ83_03940 [Eubacteriaceae bacterium]|jgi:hypothetical protein|nr:hypothetical protein [Eubacteriaceae bacterium]